MLNYKNKQQMSFSLDIIFSIAVVLFDCGLAALNVPVLKDIVLNVPVLNLIQNLSGQNIFIQIFEVKTTP